MSNTLNDILVLAQSRADAENARIVGDHGVQMDIANTVFLIAAILDGSFKENRERGDIIQMDTKEAAETFDEDMAAGRVAYVRYVCNENERRYGDVVKTTAKSAAKLAPFVTRITEEQARRFARLKRSQNGRWMESDQWLKFASSFKRLLVAGAVRRAA